MRYVFMSDEGRLYNADGFVCDAYSGYGAGKDNPVLQDVRDVGPIPEGLYVLGAPRLDPKLGPDAIPLTPAIGTNTFGRNGFFIHGDSIDHPGCASHGCVIVPPWVRSAMQSGDTLMVTCSDVATSREAA